MQYELQVFEYQDRQRIRTVEIDGDPWFVLADVCRALELQAKDGYYGHHADRLEDDQHQVVKRSEVEKANPPLRGEGRSMGGPTLTVISESGLYSLIFRSDKQSAKRFRRWVTRVVLPTIRKTGMYRDRLPAFVTRFNANWDRVGAGHFSVISELFIRIYGRFEQVGYQMADTAADGKELRPDISVGRRLSTWLKEKHPDVCDDYSMYWHWTPAGDFEARQYPNKMLPLFIEFVETVWLPEFGRDYFAARDPQALPYLPKLLPPPASGKSASLPRPPRPARRQTSGLIATPPARPPSATRRV
jgi:prophage antirepressor-like protein